MKSLVCLLLQLSLDIEVISGQEAILLLLHFFLRLEVEMLGYKRVLEALPLLVGQLELWQVLSLLQPLIDDITAALGALAEDALENLNLLSLSLLLWLILLRFPSIPLAVGLESKKHTRLVDGDFTLLNLLEEALNSLFLFVREVRLGISNLLGVCFEVRRGKLLDFIIPVQLFLLDLVVLVSLLFGDLLLLREKEELSQLLVSERVYNKLLLTFVRHNLYE